MDSYIETLGLKAIDRVTGFSGTITSVSFDLYGCIQVVVTPEVNKDGKHEDGRWFDFARLDVKAKRVMPVPNFVNPNVAKGQKGPAEKPARER